MGENKMHILKNINAYLIYNSNKETNTHRH